MKTFKIAIALVLFVISNNQIKAQETKVPYIEVTGTASLLVDPDEIFITIKIKERQEKKVNIPIDNQVKALQKGLKNIGVGLSNLELLDTNASLTQLRKRRYGKEVFSETKYSLKVDNASQVQKVFQLLDKIKIEDAYISDISHSEVEKYRKQVKINAIKIAKEKAEYLTEAIGHKLIKPLEIYEKGKNSIERYGFIPPAVQGTNTITHVGSQEKSDIAFKKLNLKATFYIKYEIE